MIAAAAPLSWNATILVSAPLLSVGIWGLFAVFRDLDEPQPGDRRTDRLFLPLIIFAGVPVAITTVVLMRDIANHDGRLDGTEAAVVCAGSGAIALLIAIDLIRLSRQQRLSAAHANP